MILYVLISSWDKKPLYLFSSNKQKYFDFNFSFWRRQATLDTPQGVISFWKKHSFETQVLSESEAEVLLAKHLLQNL